MAISTVLFDLDGTLLPIRQIEFVKAYFDSISRYIAPLGYKAEDLVASIKKGTYSMVNGDGTRPNEEIFWEVFCSIYGDKALNDKPYFDRYYEEEFDKLKSYSSYNPKAAETLYKLKDMGFRLVLATNPLFPPIAIQKRLNWAGLSHNDFELYTTYENSSYCKPNPDYYREIMKKQGLTPDECIMVGNDVDDDMIASNTGMKVFLMTDYLINRHDKDISVYPQGNFDDLLNYILRR